MFSFEFYIFKLKVPRFISVNLENNLLFVKVIGLYVNFFCVICESYKSGFPSLRFLMPLTLLQSAETSSSTSAKKTVSKFVCFLLLFFYCRKSRSLCQKRNATVSISFLLRFRFSLWSRYVMILKSLQRILK